MRIWIISDLHQEFSELRWRPEKTPDHDVLVLAGDIDVTCAKAIEYAKTLSDKPIIMVAGNHEFYGQNLDRQLADARQRASTIENLFYLENETVVIGGTRFIGATLWMDFELLGELLSWQCQREAIKYMNDFQMIEVGPDEIDRTGPRHHSGKVYFSPRHAGLRHNVSAAFIQTELAQPFDGPTVVVTHHAPHRYSIPVRRQNDLLSACYASDLSSLILSGHPDLWIHGHVHESADYEIGHCRVVSNPRGYPGESESFEENLVIALDAYNEDRPAPTLRPSRKAISLDRFYEIVKGVGSEPTTMELAAASAWVEHYYSTLRHGTDNQR
ncbi:metallophosphoesterase [Ochrobactrum sp. SFR4]|uniref:metallophosphoesterase n=1 Tax=Ochrobactrum sp. SFR4 TaxID=2717368 RepID=UPI001C8BA08D|nr:metallophosphoesterase [Ochrobactrum sp. SFR4]MBX8826271.1 phosphatase [Ochrobactrum sp. SFR4]